MKRAILLLTLFLAVPAAAEAATVDASLYMECNGDTRCSKYQAGTMETLLGFSADAGEANALTIEPRPDGRVRVHDAGAPLRATGRCEVVSPQEAVCPAPRRVVVDLRDGDDRAAVAAGVRATLTGGPGEDVIVGGAQEDFIAGGPDADRVDAGGGADELVGSGAGTPADVLDGGDGVDVVDYGERTTAVSVTLGRDDPATPDRLARIEGAIGGSGDDVLVGSDAADALSGGDGEDQLQGNGGDDQLNGGTGRDRIDGGDGDDVLATYDGIAERVVCGPGTDAVRGQVVADEFYGDLAWYGGDAADVLSADCERTALRGSTEDPEPLEVSAGVAVVRGLARVRNPCATIADRPCSGVLRLRSRGTRARRRFRSGTRWVRVRLPRAGRHVRVSLTVDVAGFEADGAWTAVRSR